MPRILVVDDQEYCRVALERLLKSYGFIVQTAPGGHEALDLLDGFRPKFVILDLNMPLMDGYQFLEVARSRTQRSTYDVLIYTADQDADVARLLCLGAVKVCEKAPGGLDCLLQAVSRRLPSPHAPAA